MGGGPPAGAGAIKMEGLGASVWGDGGRRVDLG